MSKPVLLLYDPTSSPWQEDLKRLCVTRKVRLRPVSPAETGHALRALSAGKPDKPESAMLIPEPLLVLCDLPPKKLDRLLGDLRTCGVPVSCLKAVLTPTNERWSLATLYRELCRERLAMGRR